MATPTMETLSRGEVARRTGVNIETVRYYEQRGLIPKPSRSGSGYRQYTEDYIVRIRFVKRAQELGFTLKEISELLALRIDPDSDRGEVRRRAEVKADDIAKKILDLQSMRNALMDLAGTCDGCGPTSDCPILDALDDGCGFSL